MPIVGSGEDVRVEYSIPNEVDSRIPPYFYAAFAGELVSVLGTDALDKDEVNLYNVRYVCGTTGWNAAFNMACRKLGLKWLIEYYKKLPWYDSDYFDDIIAERVVSEFIEAKHTGADPYYLYLLQCESEGAKGKCNDTGKDRNGSPES